MHLDRVANIRCVIRDGQAYLAAGESRTGNCHGLCSTCSSFLGVDIRQVGQPYLEGDCCNAAPMDIRRQGTVLDTNRSTLH